MQLTKIRWEEALNVAKSETDELEGAWQVKISTQLKKLNYRYLKKHVVSDLPCLK